MAEEEPKKVVEPEKALVPLHPPPPPTPSADDKTSEAKALAVVEKPLAEKINEGSINRDIVLARVETEKRLSLIREWEESEKARADNKYAAPEFSWFVSFLSNS